MPVKEPVGKYQITKPPAGGSQFINLDQSRECVKRVSREEECGRLLDVRAAEVDFQPADNGSPLPVVTELEAENATLWARIRWYEGSHSGLKESRIEGRVTQAAAAMDADIEPDLIGNVSGGRRDLRRRPRRQIRCDG
jgi:hypothetical protein